MTIHNKKILIAAALLTLIAVAGIVFAFQNKTDTSKNQDTNPPADQSETASAPELKRDNVDLRVNRRAKQVESEAASLMQSAPLEASKKYQEAAKVYTEAKNFNKAADMNDNAKTAESLAPVEPPKVVDPLITPQSPPLVD